PLGRVEIRSSELIGKPFPLRRRDVSRLGEELGGKIIGPPLPPACRDCVQAPVNELSDSVGTKVTHAPVIPSLCPLGAVLQAHRLRHFSSGGAARAPSHGTKFARSISSVRPEGHVSFS